MTAEPSKKTVMDRMETFFKIATPLGAIIAFLVGIYHYRDTRNEEFRKAYWDKRYNVYEEVSHLASRVANAGSQDQLDSVKSDFWILYTGKSMLVEDLHVYDALKSYGRTLNRAVFPDSMPVLQEKAHLISKACRISLKETWEPVPVNEIKAMEN